MRRTIGTLLAAAAVLAAGAGSTHAATPFNAGVGYGHAVAVGADGIGHVAWLTDEPGDRVSYCRVPAGGTVCDRTEMLSFPGGADAFSIGDVAQVFAPAPSKVVLLGSCFVCGGGGAADRVFRWISTNNGQSFGAPEEVGGDLAMGDQGAYLNATETFLGVEGGQFLATDNLPGVEDAEITLGGGFPFVYTPSVVPGPVAGRVVHAVSDLATVKYAVFTDPTPGATAAAELNDIVNWQTGRFLDAAEGDNDETTLSSGPSGVFLTYKYFVPNDNRIGLRKFDPVTNTFGAPAYVEGDDSIDNNSADYPESTQDPSGRIHVAWRSLFDGGRLRYRVSDTSGGNFGAVGNLAVKETFIDPELSAGPDGKGLAVWKGIGTSPIRVVALDPQPEPAPPPTGGGTTTTPPAVAPPVTTPAAVVKRTTTTVPGATITFETPSGCVRPGSSFVVTLKWKKQRRKGNLFVKITRTDFYIGTKRVKIDRRVPFRQTLRITNARRGATYTLRARAFIKVKRGKAPKKSIKTTIKVCA